MHQPTTTPAVTPEWLGGIAYEIAFWNNVYRWPHTFKGMTGWAHHGSAIALEGFDANSFLLQTGHPKVYDVGCGMSYAVGSHLERDGQSVPLDIHYMDPLAFHFNKILRKYRKRLPAIEFGMAEYLSAFIPCHDATLIVIQNALDHSSTPVKGIAEAMVALQLGGTLYLNHHPNEAEMEKYKGFHQYNIDEKDGELVIWNRQERFNVSQMLGGYATVEVRRMADTGHIVAIITKRTGSVTLPVALQRYVNDSRDKGELCEVLLRFQQTGMPIGGKLRDSVKFWTFNTVQFLAQMLPWDLKMRVKRIIRQA